MTATQTLQQFCGEIGRGSQRREPLVNYNGDAATRRYAFLPKCIWRRNQHQQCQSGNADHFLD